MEGVAKDHRISPHFLNAGIGFGGSCLPKDLRALIAYSKDIKYEPKILEQVLKLNEEQPTRIIKLLKNDIVRLVMNKGLK